MLEITLRTEIKDKNGHNLTHSLAQQDFFICTTVLGRGFSKCKAPCKAKCLKTPIIRGFFISKHVKIAHSESTEYTLGMGV